MAKGLLGRILIIVILGAIGLFVLLGLVPLYNKSHSPPNITEAPWAIQTSSRVYYARQFTVVQGVPEIKNYWTKDRGTYRYIQGLLSFPHNVYGNIKVIRRAEK